MTIEELTKDTNIVEEIKEENQEAEIIQVAPLMKKNEKPRRGMFKAPPPNLIESLLMEDGEDDDKQQTTTTTEQKKSD